MSMSCPKCGAIVSDDSAFCSKCGTKLTPVKKEEVKVEETKKVAEAPKAATATATAATTDIKEETVTSTTNKETPTRPQYDKANAGKQFKELMATDPTFKGLVDYKFRHALTYLICAILLLIGAIITINVKTLKLASTGEMLSLANIYKRINNGSLISGSMPSSFFNMNIFYIILVLFAFTILAMVIVLEFMNIFLNKDLVREYLVEGPNACVKTLNKRVLLPNSFADIALLLLLFPGILYMTLNYKVFDHIYYVFDIMIPLNVFITILVTIVVICIIQCIGVCTWLKKSNNLVKAIKNGEIK